MTPTSLRSGTLRAILFALCSFAAVLTAAAADTAKKPFSIPAGPALETLKEFTNQSGHQLLYSGDAVEGVRTKAIEGSYTSADALARMFAGTGMTVVQDKKAGDLSLRRETPAEAKNDSRRPVSDRAASARTRDDGTLVLDTFEVMDSKLLNMDIRRSRDDAQPYIIFSRTAINNAGATNLEDFLKQRLTMNAQGQTNDRTAGGVGNASQINLRGLGTNQTLILIDGHRVANFAFGGIPQQHDLNGIPLEAIERVEVLPTTASGIYGGSATGGVINVVLRRDYSGAEIKTTYQNTFDTDSGIRRVELSAGFTLEEGKTNVLLTGSYSTQNVLESRDRDFVKDGRAQIVANAGLVGLNTGTVPPQGYTTNIRSSTGANLTLKPSLGGTALNSPITFVPLGYAGASFDGGAGLVANAGKYDLGLGGNASLGGNRTILSGPTIESFSITVRRQFNDSLQAFVELAASNNTAQAVISQFTGAYAIPITASNNPFNQAITVSAPIPGLDGASTVAVYDRRAVIGLIAKLPGDWKAESDFTWDRTRFFSVSPGTPLAPATTAISNGTIDVLRDTNLYRPDFTSYIGPPSIAFPTFATLKDAALRVEGPLKIPYRALQISALVEHRDELFADAYFNSTATTQLFYPSRSQNIDSVYIETLVPILPKRSSGETGQELDLQLAVRRDWYAANGSNSLINLLTPVPVVRTTNHLASTDPTIALRYVPFPDLMFRASYGTGFLPPGVNQLVPASPSISPVSGLVDPRRGGGAITGNLTLFSGGNPSLKPELSTSRSIGIVLSPRLVPGLRLSVDWLRIEKTDIIQNLSVSQSLLDNEAYLPGRIIRGVVPVGDPYSVGPVTGLDVSSVNISRATVEAYDVTLDFEKKTSGFGSFNVFALATWQTHFRTQLLPTAPVVENAGHGDSAFTTLLKFKANAGVTWTSGRFTAGWSVRYFDSYLVSPANAAKQGNGGRVSSQVYNDVFASCRLTRTSRAFGHSAAYLANTEVRLGVNNVLNKQPPVDVSATGVLYSQLGDPRLANYSLSIRHAF